MARAGATVVIVGRREATLREACGEIGEEATYEVATSPNLPPSERRLNGSPHGSAGFDPCQQCRHPSEEGGRGYLGRGISAVLDTHVLAAHNLCRLVLPG